MKYLKCLISIPIAILFITITPASVYAEGNMAVAGTFSGWEFNLPVGGESSSQDTYLTVINNSNQNLTVSMSFSAPSGVDILFSEEKFTLSPGQSTKVIVGLKVNPQCAPGEYDVVVMATAAVQSETGGIGVATALGQKAHLTVTGESALVTIQATSPDGTLIIASINLLKIVNGQKYKVASSDTGALKAKVAPGDFVATVSMGNEKLNETTFSVIPGETKNINLSAATVFFEGFGVVPAYSKDTKELAFLKMVYTVQNLYRTIDKAEIFLNVTHNGQSVEEVLLATLGPLEKGQVGLNYNYIPTNGWMNGQYGFTLQLDIDGKPYTNSATETFDAAAGAIIITTNTNHVDSKNSNLNIYVSIGAIAAGLLVIGSGIWFIKKRRRKV
jgi:hypothetical protein